MSTPGVRGWAVAMLAAVVLGGCGPRAATPRGQTDPSLATPSGAPSGPSRRVASPDLKLTQSGLELWTWFIADERQAIVVQAPEKPLGTREKKSPPQSSARDAAERSGNPSDTPAPDQPQNGVTEPSAGRPRVADPDPGSPTFRPASRPRPGDLPPPDPALEEPKTVTVIDDRADLDALLAPLAERPVPISDAARERWRRAGFRFYAVPLQDLANIEFQARLTGVVERQWLGQLPLWTDLATGAELREATLVELDAGPKVLPPGRPRLLARAWTVPVPRESGPPAAALHLELQPQVAPPAATPRPRRSLADPSADRPLPIEQQGTLIDTLLADLSLEPGQAILVVPDAMPSPAGDPAGSPESTAIAPGSVAFVTPPRLGPLMLTTPAGESTPRVRRVLVLIPRVPDRFQMLP